MSIPKEPRQQMINIMYLVLIAMLALSVSAEILNAFKVVNRGISNSNEAISGQIDATLLAFEDKLKKNNDGRKYYDAAQKAGTITDELIAYIDDVEQLLRDESGINEATGDFSRQEDQDTPSRVMIGTNKSGKAYELQKEILATRDKYVGLFKQFGARDMKNDITYLESSMPLNAPAPPADSDKTDWASYNFYEMPVIAVSTLLNQIRNDAIASEAMVVQRFSEKIGGVSPKIDFNTMKVAVVPNATRVVAGETFSAEIFVASTSTTNRPTIQAGGQTLALKSDGSAVYTHRATKLGKQNVSGVAMVRDANGQLQELPFTTEYEVIAPPPTPENQDDIVAQLQQQIAQAEAEIERLKNIPIPTRNEPTPTGVVSPDKMNVFYIGVDNPISVSVSGVNLDDVKTSISIGQLTKSGRGKYMVQVPGPPGKKTNIGLTVGRKNINSQEFRIKKIPDPVPKVGGKSGGVMGTGEMKAQMGVIADLENFDFDARFDVLGFELTLAQRGEDLLVISNPGAKFSEDSQKLLNKAKVGSIYYFDNIRVKGPDKIVRKLPTISFKIM